MESTENRNCVQTGYVSAVGGRIWYKVVGKDRPGIPLLAVHGGPGAAHDYLEPLEALANERPVIFYDQLDCGNSEKTDNHEFWTVEHYRNELRRFRREMGLRKVYILGQSWGTVPAVEHALSKQCEGVAGLVLSGPMLNATLWAADQKAYLAELSSAVRDTILKNEAAKTFDSPAYHDAVMEFYRRHVCRLEQWPDCLNRTFAKINIRLYQYMWGASEFTVTGTLKDYDCMARLKELAVPVLFTCGQYDEANPETVRKFQRRVRGSELHVFDGASHEHHLEKTDEYLAVVRDFLARADRGTKR